MSNEFTLELIDKLTPEFYAAAGQLAGLATISIMSTPLRQLARPDCSDALHQLVRLQTALKVARRRGEGFHRWRTELPLIESLIEMWDCWSPLWPQSGGDIPPSQTFALAIAAELRRIRDEAQALGRQRWRAAYKLVPEPED